MARFGRSYVKTIYTVFGEIIPQTFVDTNTIAMTLDASQSVEQYSPAAFHLQTSALVQWAIKRASTW